MEIDINKKLKKEIDYRKEISNAVDEIYKDNSKLEYYLNIYGKDFVDALYLKNFKFAPREHEPNKKIWKGIIKYYLKNNDIETVERIYNDISSKILHPVSLLLSDTIGTFFSLGSPRGVTERTKTLNEILRKHDFKKYKKQLNIL